MNSFLDGFALVFGMLTGMFCGVGILMFFMGDAKDRWWLTANGDGTIVDSRFFLFKWRARLVMRRLRNDPKAKSYRLDREWPYLPKAETWVRP